MAVKKKTERTNDSALKIAEYLLQIKAIKLQPDKPFTWASGWKSPIYCDNRRTLSYPKIRDYIRDQFLGIIESKYGKPDVIVGVATGGIAHGILVAEALNLPFAYVRAEAKVHGLSNLIEGVVGAGQKAVVVEDLVSTGASSLKAVDSLRHGHCEVKGMVSIFNYGFQVAADAFKKANCQLTSLCTYDILIEQALKAKTVSEKDLTSLKSWRLNPAEWGK